jgi:hypothetical protein
MSAFSWSVSRGPPSSRSAQLNSTARHSNGDSTAVRRARAERSVGTDLMSAFHPLQTFGTIAAEVPSAAIARIRVIVLGYTPADRRTYPRGSSRPIADVKWCSVGGYG